MLTAQSPISGTPSQRPKSGRKPLQPKNSPATPITNVLVKKPKLKKSEWIEISIAAADGSNKENRPVDATPPKIEPCKIESLDASLAEELSAIREKLERLRMDKEKTEKMLRERDAMMDMQMKEMGQRGEDQKQLEIEVDRLYRLNQLRLSCMRISPIRSLRDREQEKRRKGSPLKNENVEVSDESSTGEILFPSPSSEIDTDK